MANFWQAAAAVASASTSPAAIQEGLAAYADALGPAWQDTVVVVISEFGRTFRENGSKGTDHGHGTAYWVLGGAVHGGRGHARSRFPRGRRLAVVEQMPRARAGVALCRAFARIACDTSVP